MLIEMICMEVSFFNWGISVKMVNFVIKGNYLEKYNRICSNFFFVVNSSEELSTALSED